MSGLEERGATREVAEVEFCAAARLQFSDYLDGALDGRRMGTLAGHLQQCMPCAREFDTWRAVQEVLGELGPAKAPKTLQSQLRDALASERVRGTYRAPSRRFSEFYRRTLAPFGLRAGAGLAGALLLLSGLSWIFGSAMAVQANDDRMANLVAPHYLYSITSPQPVVSDGRYVAVLVDAKVDARGHVYDYAVIAGPNDTLTRSRVESNLLESVFRPATVFGVPVPGHAVVTYTTVSVRG